MVALEIHGPTYSFQRVQANDGVFSLAFWDDTGFAVGVDANHIILFRMSSCELHGNDWKRISPFRDCMQVMVSSRWPSLMTRDLQLVQMHVCARLPSSGRGGKSLSNSHHVLTLIRTFWRSSRGCNSFIGCPLPLVVRISSLPRQLGSHPDRPIR